MDIRSSLEDHAIVKGSMSPYLEGMNLTLICSVTGGTSQCGDPCILILALCLIAVVAHVELIVSYRFACPNCNLVRGKRSAIQ